ncbi:MAG: flippase-like domain-containing protein [Proteobacteria bacterium]|nr:flippase-like domain-containing protein [Pseudomonadota bacterium]
MNKKMMVSLITGILFSAGALYLAFKNIPFGELSAYLASINYFWMIPTTLVIIVCFILRVIRWQIILSSTKRLDFWQAFHPLMIGFMLNCVLPARIGELARPAIIKKKHNIPFTTGFATVAAERLFDMVFLVCFLAVVLATVPMDPEFHYSYKEYQLDRETLKTIGQSMVVFCLILITGIATISLDRSRNMIIKILQKIPALLSLGVHRISNAIKIYLTGPLESLVINIASGFSLVKNPLNLFNCIFLSMAIWGLSVLSYYLFSLGCPGVSLSFFQLATVMIIICFFIALPSAPGFWGLWEAGGIFAMMLFGISGKEAAGFNLANHAIQMIPVIIIGIVSAMLSSINIFKIADDAS